MEVLESIHSYSAFSLIFAIGSFIYFWPILGFHNAKGKMVYVGHIFLGILGANILLMMTNVLIDWFLSDKVTEKSGYGRFIMFSNYIVFLIDISIPISLTLIDRIKRRKSN